MKNQDTQKLLSNQAPQNDLEQSELLLKTQTENIRLKAEIRKLSERNNNILLSIGEAFFTLDKDWKFSYANNAAGLLLERPAAELIGKSIWEEYPGLIGSPFEPIYRGTMQDRVESRITDYYPDHKRWYEINIFPAAAGITVYLRDVTAKKESEEKYQLLFNSIDEGFCTIELIFDENDKAVDYIFLDMNAAFEKHCGLVNAKGKRLREFAPDYEDFWFEIYGRVALTGESVRFENYSEVFDRWWDVYAFRVGNLEKNRIAVLFNDISERKRAEITIREAEERYRALTEATSTTVWHATPEGALSYVGEKWAGVTGQSNEEILKWGWLEALHPDDREPTIEKWQTALKNKTLYSTEFRILTNTGNYRWFAVNAVPIFKADGSVREWIGSNINISPRKRAEEERAESLQQLEVERSRLAYIFEQAPAFVAVLHGSEHSYELTNPAYRQLIGHRNLIGKTVREALPELADQGYFELLDNVFQSGKPFIGREMAVEFQYAPESVLEKRFVDFVFQPIFDGDGKSAGIFVHGVDITEQMEARQEAETANQLKDEFLATVSHELRTPLNAILGWLQILKSRELNEIEREKALAIIDRSAQSQNQLIEDILDVSRIITGNLRLDVQAVDLLKVISSAVDTVRPAAEAKNIRLQTMLDPKATGISGDPERLQQVIWNLLSNAVKFTPKGGSVQIRLERVNSHIEITVSDTGKGIEEKFLPHVFDRFRQSDGSTTRRQGGLGLGLAIVRQIVELHGGTVAVESLGIGEGSTFFVHLPLLPLRTEPNTRIPRIHPSIQSFEASLINKKSELADLSILVVDDEADSRDLLKFLLNSRGAMVTLAGSVAEAYGLLQENKFDLLISDIGMPEEDGFSLIKRIRKIEDETISKIPAIALTAYARTEDRILALESGFQTHIAKPVNHLELIAIIVNLTGRIKI